MDAFYKHSFVKIQAANIGCKPNTAGFTSQAIEKKISKKMNAVVRPFLSGLFSDLHLKGIIANLPEAARVRFEQRQTRRYS
jgi:hypothetical protein